MSKLNKLISNGDRLISRIKFLQKSTCRIIFAMNAFDEYTVFAWFNVFKDSLVKDLEALSELHRIQFLIGLDSDELDFKYIGERLLPARHSYLLYAAEVLDEYKLTDTEESYDRYRDIRHMFKILKWGEAVFLSDFELAEVR